MRRSRNIAAVAAAIGLTVTGTMGVYAADYALPSESFKETEVTDGEGVESVLNGTIAITDISVQVPISASFDIDPNKKLTAGSASTQLSSQATNYTITNTSRVPLTVKISAVTTTAAGFTNDMDTLDTVDKQVMFAIRKWDNTPPKLPSTKEGKTDDQNKWLVPKSGATKGELAADYVITDTEGDSTLDADGTLNMKLYGAIKNGWKTGETFQVKPVFKISLVPATT